jgi:hypothetical protein
MRRLGVPGAMVKIIVKAVAGERGFHFKIGGQKVGGSLPIFLEPFARSQQHSEKLNHLW